MRLHAESFPQLRWGRRHGARRRCLGTMRQEQSCLAIAGRTFAPKISLIAEQILSQMDLTSAPIRSQPHQTNRRLAKFLPRENNQVIFCSNLPMLQQEA